MKQIFITKEDIPLHIRFLKLVYDLIFITSVCSCTNTRSGKSKNANRIDCKIMHFLVTQTLPQYISTIALDDNEKISIN